MATYPAAGPPQINGAPRAARFPKSLQLCLGTLGIMLSLWLLWPVTHPVHVEALSARSQSLAILAGQGKVSLDDQAYPINVEYFYDLRLGTVTLLSWLMRVTHSTGELNFRLLTWTSFIVFLGASLAFARRWSSSPLSTMFAFILLTPGLIEIGFYFSDNLPSAAFACLALALISRRTSLGLWAVIGVLVAASILCRSDGILILPGIVSLSLLRERLTLRRIALDWLALTAGVASVLALSWHVTGISLIHILRVSGWIGRMHAAGNDSLRLAHFALSSFFGLPSLLLLSTGVGAVWAWQTRRERLVLTVYPILFYLYFITRAIEPRNFLLLGAPFLVLHGAAGMHRFVRILTRPIFSQRLLALGLGAVCLLVMILPPRVLVSDGPHSFTGRLWTPLLWRQWQSMIQADMTRMDGFINQIQPHDRVLVVGVSFQAERYLHLKLLEHGFDLQPLASSTESSQFADVYRLGTKTVLVLRTEQPFALYTLRYPTMSFAYPPEFELATQLAALQPGAYDHAFMMTWGEQAFYQDHVAAREFNREAGPMMEIIPRQSLPAGKRQGYGRLRIIPLSQASLTDLQDQAYLKMHDEERSGNFPPLRNYAQLKDAFGCHFCTLK